MSEWISVEERLPEEGIECLVWRIDGVGGEGVFLDSHEDGEWYQIAEFDDFSASVGMPEGVACAVPRLKVTHWMPLPEPPKGA